MPAEILITDIVDVQGNAKDLDALIAHLNRVDNAIQNINKNPIKLGQVTGLKELKSAIDQLQIATNQLTASMKSLSETNIGRTFSDHANHVNTSTKATKENTEAQKENLTWSQFVSQRMGQYMKIYGDHATAIRKISEEWKQYKSTGESAIQTSDKIANAQSKEASSISQKDASLAALNEKYQQATVLAKNLSDQFGAESEQALNAAKGAAQLKAQIDELSVTQPAATAPNVSAYDQLQKATKEAEINAKNLAAQFGVDSKKALEAAASYDILKQKLEAVNSVTKKKQAAQFDPNTVPYVQNPSAVDNEAEAINATGEAVNNLNKAEAEATNQAIVWGAEQTKTTETVKEQAGTIPEVVSALDEYTGSITRNIQIQIENNSSLAANRAEQRLIQKEIAASGGATEEQTQSLIRLKQEELVLIDTQRALGQTIKNQVRDFTAVDGSINSMRAKLALLQQQYESLSVTEKASPFGQNLKTQIDVIDPALKKAEESIGKAQRQVGSYHSAITDALKGSFSWLRQIAYILPGIGIAGILSAAIDPAVALVKSMFDLGEGLDRDTSKLGELKENLAQFNAEVRKGVEDLDDYFKYLDRLKNVSLSDLKINDINVEPITKLRNQLNGLQLDVSTAQNKYNELKDAFDKTALDAGQIQSKFLNEASPDAIKAFNNGTIEALKDGLNETDKVLYQGLLDANKAYEEASNKFADAFAARNAAVDKVNEQVKEIAKEISDEERQITRDNAVAVENILKAKNAAILSDERSSLNERLNAIRANYASEIAIIRTNEQFVLSDPTKSKADKNAAIQQAKTDSERSEITLQQTLFKTREEYRKKDIEADKQMFVQKKQLEAELLKEIATSNEFSITDRVAFQESAFQAQKAIIDKEHEAKLESVKNTYLTDEEKLAIEKDYETKLLELTRKNQADLSSIIESSIERREQLSKEEVESIERIYRDINLSQSEQYTQDVIDLNNSLRSKLVSYDAYLKQRRELDNKYRLQAIQSGIDKLETELNKPVFDQAKVQLQASEAAVTFFQSRLANARTENEREAAASSLVIARKDLEIAKGNYDDKVKLEGDLNNFKRQKNEEGLKIDEEDFKRRLNNLSGYLEQASQLASQIGSFGSAIHQRRLNEIATEQDALDARYQKEQELIRQAYTSQIDQQQKLAEAEKRYNAQKDQLQQRQRQEQIKQARFEKEANIASIILNTAAAVVKALPNIPLSIIAGVIGAAQLAVAIATPLPKFYKGKNVNGSDNYEGYAWVDDGGKPEAIIREDGSVEIGTNKPRVTYLKSKDIVLPDASVLAWKATASTAAAREGYVVNNTFDSTEIVSELKVNNRLLKSIKNKQPFKIYRTDPMDSWINGKINTNDLFG